MINYDLLKVIKTLIGLNFEFNNKYACVIHRLNKSLWQKFILSVAEKAVLFDLILLNVFFNFNSIFCTYVNITLFVNCYYSLCVI